jgi:hypothetical protein
VARPQGCEAIRPPAALIRSPAAPIRPLAAPIRGPRSRLYLVCALGAVALAAASLAYPSAPAYDPWAWIIWGRQILHLDLVTTGGPTWKPLPVVFTTLFAPFGSAAPDLWLVVARAGGIMAVGLAALLAYRLTAARDTRAAGAHSNRFAALAAAALAAAGLVLLAGFPDTVALGESEGLSVAALLLAILCILDGAPRAAFALGFAAALIRPEVWPFFFLYGAYLWRRDRGARKLITALFALTPALWFLPELWGSGSLSRGVQWAQHVRAGSPALTHCPFCSELSGQAWPLTIAPFKMGLAFLLGLAAVGAIRRTPLVSRTVVALAGVGLAWILEEAVLTQVGFSGSDRYLMAPVALLIIAGATGWGSVLVLARRLAAPRMAPRLAATWALALVGACLAATIPWRGSHLARVSQAASAVRYQAALLRDLRLAVSQAGGAERLASCGDIETNPSEAPLAAWTLHVQMRQTESADGNVLIQLANAEGAPVAPRSSAKSRYELLARVAAVSILARCRPDDRVRAASNASGPT